MSYNVIYGFYEARAIVVHGDVEDSNIEKNRIYFNILKPNIALLPCYKNDIMLTETSNNLTNYFEKFTTNSPTACQRFCQVAEDCYFLPISLKQIIVGSLMIV